MPDQYLPHLLDARARERGDHIALIGNDGSGDYRSVSYAELRDLAARVGTVLAALIPPERTTADQRRICWAYANSSSLVANVLYHAIVRIGAVNVPISPDSTREELDRVIAAVDPVVMIAPPRMLPSEELPVLTVSDFDSLLELARTAEPFEADRVSADPDRPAVILFTSGTTGRSKGVVHSHRSAIAAGRGWSTAFELGPNDVYQAMYPAYAGSGLHFSGVGCIVAGCTYVIDETRPTSASLSRVDQFGTTVYAAVPSIFQYWLAEDRAAFDLSSLRLLDFGGAVMHRSTIAALREFLPGVDLIQTYGLTEAGPGGLYLPPADLDAKLGSIGSRTTWGLRMRLDTSVATGEYGSLPGEVGELQFAGDSVMLEYLDDPQATESVRDGEWLRTGDLVRIDPDGYVFFLDRLKDLILRGGYNISSIEVEEALLKHPGVREIAAFGYPHDTLGEVVAVAIVAQSSGLSLPDLRDFAAERLGRMKVPERIVVLEALPLTAAGKVQKAALRTHPGLLTWDEAIA